MAHRDTHRHIGTQKAIYELKHENYQNLRILQGTVYRKNDKYGTRSVIRKCDLETFFAIPIVEATMKPLQEFPGIDNCYSIGEIQKKFSISPAGLYLLLQRQGIAQYTVGKYTYVAKADIDLILNDVRI